MDGRSLPQKQVFSKTQIQEMDYGRYGRSSAVTLVWVGPTHRLLVPLLLEYRKLDGVHREGGEASCTFVDGTSEGPAFM